MKGYFGLERENLRITKDTGRLAQTPHPFEVDPHISKDFCESQLELITPVAESIDDVFAMLEHYSGIILEKLFDIGETLHNYSNPPAIYSESEIHVARFEGEDRIKEDYRYYLKDRYGLWVMLLSGIHFNFSFADDALEILTEMYGETPDRLYLKLAAACLEHAWLIAYLTAASPVVHSTYGGRTVTAASLRCSSAGYWNDFLPVLDYSDLIPYIDSIEKLVADGLIRTPWELYLPVRLKPRGANDLRNLRSGIDHIELRMIDLNPLYSECINKTDIIFIHLLIVFLACRPPYVFGKKAQEAAVRNMQSASLLEDPFITDSSGKRADLKQEALSIISEMEDFFGPLDDDIIREALAFQRQKLEISGERYADRVLKLCESC
ncbi:MAG: glutathione synthase [Lachnospiraceae bacterium]|nr:glutathione synthase [Lachnospiraceae bacterium]